MSSSPSSTAPGTTTYHEPHLPQLLTLVALLYLLQLARGIANRVLRAGLLGEIAVGVVLGPVAKILDKSWEETFIAVGYVGLVLIVFEGGLTLRPSSFLSVLPLAILCALVGVLLPMAFTFALFSAPSFGYPPLQAFTAGSALASTSLGTTFYVLRAAGPSLGLTRVGEILKGAALFDDILALCLLSVIQALGDDPSSVTGLGWTIGQPIVASIAMAAIAPLAGRYVFAPLFRWRRMEGLVERGGRSAELFVGTAVLSAFLAISYYIGTTMLLGAFLAGVFLIQLPSSNSTVDFVGCWEDLVVPVQEHILTPLFFASIGFSIPFLSLWTGGRIWRGIVYSILMTLGKLLAGVPILLVDVFAPLRSSSEGRVEEKEAAGNTKAETRGCCEGEAGVVPTRLEMLRSESLPAAAFLGLALVARGEIGILVLQVARSSSATAANPSSVLSEEPYLVAIWAVALCTIVGPVGFGALVARVGGRISDGKWGRM